MKSIAVIFLFALSAMLAAPAFACWAKLPDPQRDAETADTIFVGTVIAQRRLPAEGPLIRSALTIASTAVLKGNAPIQLVITPGCGDHYPKLQERVIVIRRGKSNIIRRLSDPYERQLVAALEHGR